MSLTSNSKSNSTAQHESDETKAVHTGSCLCKAVKYTVTGPPSSFLVCHCQNCKKATGSAFMSNVFFNGDNIRVVQGQDKLKYYADPETWNKSPITRVFCGECGSNLFLHPSSEDAVRTNRKIVTFGTLDEDVPWVPKLEWWPDLMPTWIHGIEITGKKNRSKDATKL